MRASCKGRGEERRARVERTGATAEGGYFVALDRGATQAEPPENVPEQVALKYVVNKAAKEACRLRKRSASRVQPEIRLETGRQASMARVVAHNRTSRCGLPVPKVPHMKQAPMYTHIVDHLVKPAW